MTPTILVNAFDRPASLQRLLGSLLRAEIPPGAPLAISIDGGGDPAVIELARSTPWPFGLKEVRVQPRNLGLVEHFLHCGGLTREFGDLIYLEDDLAVSRQFFRFAVQALDAYREDARIAGISLNRLRFNGYTKLPFEPLLDQNDVFFAQVYWYQGQVYTPEMWSDFEQCWETDRRPVSPEDGLHPLFLPHPRWKNEFFPQAMRYLHQTGRFFAFPRESHATNFGDPGTHFTDATHVFQVPLQHLRQHFRLGKLDEACAVYDSFFELLPENFPALAPELPFDVDLNGTKPPGALKSARVLTTRPVHRALHTFALAERPLEMNVLDQVPGKGIALAPREAVRSGLLADLQTEARLRRHLLPDQISLRRRLLLRLAARLDR